MRPTAPSGTRTVQGRPSLRAAQATARPWFPELIVLMPRVPTYVWDATPADDYNSTEWIYRNDTAAQLKPLLHLWSLGVEEQFYILWPVLLIVAWKLRLNVLAVIVVFGLTSFAFSALSSTNPQPSLTTSISSSATEALRRSGMGHSHARCCRCQRTTHRYRRS